MRVERVISNANAQSRVNGDVAIPPGIEIVQVVVHRNNFRANTTQTPVADVTIFVDGEYMGHVQWAGGDAPQPRPGQDMLWSTAWWPIPSGNTLTVQLDPVQRFNCRLDVDFF